MGRRTAKGETTKITSEAFRSRRARAFIDSGSRVAMSKLQAWQLVAWRETLALHAGQIMERAYMACGVSIPAQNTKGSSRLFRAQPPHAGGMWAPHRNDTEQSYVDPVLRGEVVCEMRRYVAVDDAADGAGAVGQGVGVAEAAENLGGEVDGDGRRRGAAGGELQEVDAVDVLHDQEHAPAVVLVEVEDINDVGFAPRSNRARGERQGRDQGEVPRGDLALRAKGFLSTSSARSCAASDATRKQAAARVPARRVALLSDRARSRSATVH